MEDDCWQIFCFEKREQLGGFYRAEGGTRESVERCSWNRKESAMKLTIALITAFALSSSLSYAQSSPGGPGTPRPAATSASSPRDTTGMAPNKSGSGTSTSGGSDANGDQGRDTMPNSNKDVKPLDQQHKPEK
jgi:hypothetical protein